jgi:hypothetical protein
VVAKLFGNKTQSLHCHGLQTGQLSLPYPRMRPHHIDFILPKVNDDAAGLEVLDVDEELGVAGGLQRSEDLFNGGLDLGTQILKKK